MIPINLRKRMADRGFTPEQISQIAEELRPLLEAWPKPMNQTEALDQYNPEQHSCFISFSHKDGEFTQYLHSKLLEADIKVYFSIEDIEAGKKIYDQIKDAIRKYSKTLIILSENSLQSEWVKTEIRYAHKIEARQRTKKLFPIRLIEYNSLEEWECFDAETGKDLAEELRQYYIPNFSNWQDYDVFEAEFNRLLRGLKSRQ